MLLPICNAGLFVIGPYPQVTELKYAKLANSARANKWEQRALKKKNQLLVNLINFSDENLFSFHHWFFLKKFY